MANLGKGVIAFATEDAPVTSVAPRIIKAVIDTVSMTDEMLQVQSGQIKGVIADASTETSAVLVEPMTVIVNDPSSQQPFWGSNLWLSQD